MHWLSEDTYRLTDELQEPTIVQHVGLKAPPVPVQGLAVQMDELPEGIPEEMVRPPKWSAVLLQVPVYFRFLWLCNSAYLWFIERYLTLSAAFMISDLLTVKNFGVNIFKGVVCSFEFD